MIKLEYFRFVSSIKRKTSDFLKQFYQVLYLQIRLLEPILRRFQRHSKRNHHQPIMRKKVINICSLEDRFELNVRVILNQESKK